MSATPSHSNWMVNGLYVCGFIFVFTETLLSPFYPQFFAQVFGIEHIATTGYYMALCRVTVMICAPLWGLAARRFDPIKLLIFSQIMTALMTLVLSFSTTIEQFFIYSIVLLMFKSSYLLFYTVLISFKQQQDEPIGQAVGLVQLVLHSAMVLSTLVSSVAITHSHPLSLFLFAALLDGVQVIICVLILRARPTPPDTTAQTTPDHTSSHGQLAQWATLLWTVFCFHLAINVIRPFFTRYVGDTPDLALSAVQSGVAYLLPSLMAFVCFPFIRTLCSEQRIRTTFLCSGGLLIAGLFTQALATHPVMLFASRAFYGVALVLVTACIDIRLFTFRQDKHLHFNYALAVAVQNISLLAAPLLASFLVARGSFTAPFYAAMCLFLAGWSVGVKAIFNRTAKTASPSQLTHSV